MVDFVGWLGTLLYAASYVSLAAGWMGRGPAFFWVNAAAAAAVAASSAALGTHAAVATNVFWAAVSLLSLRNSLRHLPRIHRMVLPIGSGGALLGSAALWAGGSQGEAAIVASWLSTGVFAIAYFRYARGNMGLKAYHFWNLLAAVSIIPKLVIDENWAVFALEAFWSAAALWGLARKSGGEAMPPV